MRPTTPNVITQSLSGQRLKGAVLLENQMLGLVFDGGRVLAVNGVAYLMHEQASRDVLHAAQHRLTEHAAEIETLRAVTEGSGVRGEAAHMRDAQAIRPPRSERRRSIGRTLDEEQRESEVTP